MTRPGAEGKGGRMTASSLTDALSLALARSRGRGSRPPPSGICKHFARAATGRRFGGVCPATESSEFKQNQFNFPFFMPMRVRSNPLM